MALSRSRLNRALQNLLKERPDINVLWRYVERCRGAKRTSAREDRALVLISVSLVEQELESAILCACTESFEESPDREKLFGGDQIGAINGLAGKITLAHALGLFGKKFKEDMETLRRLRNTFAHARQPISFRTKEIADACEFHTLNHMWGNTEWGGTQNARQKFAAAVFIAALTFQLQVKEMKGGRPEMRPDDEVMP